MQRRSFLKKASIGAVAGGAAVAAPVFAQDMPTLNWRLASSFTRSLDTLFGTSEQFAKYVSEATNGNKREALSYIQDKCTYLAHRCYRCEKNKKLQKFYVGWKKLLTAYVNAEFYIGYYLSLDQENQSQIDTKEV